MAGKKGGGSSDARWFALGVALVGTVLAVGAYQAGQLDDLLPSGTKVVRSDTAKPVKTPDIPEEAKPGGGPASTEPVLARGLVKVEPTVLEDRERTADELLTSAREAYDRGRSTDAYRFATLALRKKKTQAAYEIKAKAACRLGGKGAARSAVENLSGKRRRAVRRECRKHGVWLSL